MRVRQPEDRQRLGANMIRDYAFRRSIELRLALVLPALVIVSCFAPLLGLSLRSLSPWVSTGISLLAATVACFFLLRDGGVVRAMVLSTLAVIVGAGSLTLVSLGLRTLADSPRVDLANSIVSAMPLVLIVFAALAIAWSFSAVRGRRRILAAAWVLALATPLALAAPIFRLSDAAGNAGMDVVALFVLPLAAFFAWMFLLIASALWLPESPAAADSASSRNIQRQSS